MDRRPKVIVLLYLLLGYVVAQFVWWGYSIYDLNAELISANDALSALEGGASASANALRGKIWMIMGEGSVFLALLLIGAFYIRKFILREHRLAKQERNFLLATTHEFNSPIAAVKLNLQTLAKREVSGDQKQIILDGALSSTQRLEGLVSNILMASRLDAGKLELLKESVDLQDMLKTMKKRYALLAEMSNCSMEWAAEESVQMNVDRHAIESALGNLIENAIKYAPGGKITVGYETQMGGVQLYVADEGNGITKNERSNIFKKFYRTENEETRSQKGSGLGLYLVKELVGLHNGRITVTGNTPQGAIFTIEFKGKNT
ncbi:MAG: HAMP domain-containing histidine kinase [Flavobacteriales bacterium]|nr:HAMP domain-containing histidine kinase [Flavobacteriales bacterium]